jgi:cell division protein FtsW
MGVATGLGPVTGQPLPLLSMGGSSLLFTGAMIGIIISVSKDKVRDTAL